MAKKKAGGCIFCAIGNGEDEKTVPLYKDEDFVVFKDIKPAAPHHYLVCPIKHIKDAKALKGHHLEMVEKMIEIGKQVLTENGGNIEEARLGFHWPPFLFITHFHLHVIAPQSQMGFMARSIFMPGSLWFVTIGSTAKTLKSGCVGGRLGYHWPPATSVNHLHMHVISPADEILHVYKALNKYNPNVWRFKTADWMIDRLKKLPNEYQDQSKVVHTTES